MPVPAEATPQPGQRFLMLPSASSPLGRLFGDDDVDKDIGDFDNLRKKNSEFCRHSACQERTLLGIFTRCKSVK